MLVRLLCPVEVGQHRVSVFAQLKLHVGGKTCKVGIGGYLLAVGKKILTSYGHFLVLKIRRHGFIGQGKQLLQVFRLGK